MSRANSPPTTPSMRSTAAAMATATSPPPTVITFRISPRTSARDRGARPVQYLRHRTQRRRDRPAACREAKARSLRALVRDGADRDGSTRGPADGAALSDFAIGAVKGVLRRQAEFDSAEAAFQRFRPHRRLPNGRKLRSGPTSGTASLCKRMAGCGCAARPRLNLPSCFRSSKRWSKSTAATRAAIRSPGCPRSTAQCGLPLPTILAHL